MLPWADIGPTSARRRLLEYDELGDNFDRSGDNEVVDMIAYSQEHGRDAGEEGEQHEERIVRMVLANGDVVFWEGPRGGERRLRCGRRLDWRRRGDGIGGPGSGKHRLVHMRKGDRLRKKASM